jgi:hypothetical protein
MVERVRMVARSLFRICFNFLDRDPSVLFRKPSFQNPWSLFRKASFRTLLNLLDGFIKAFMYILLSAGISMGQGENRESRQGSSSRFSFSQKKVESPQNPTLKSSDN